MKLSLKWLVMSLCMFWLLPRNPPWTELHKGEFVHSLPKRGWSKFDWKRIIQIWGEELFTWRDELIEWGKFYPKKFSTNNYYPEVLSKNFFIQINTTLHHTNDATPLNNRKKKTRVLSSRVAKRVIFMGISVMFNRSCLSV